MASSEVPSIAAAIAAYNRMRALVPTPPPAPAPTFEPVKNQDLYHEALRREVVECITEGRKEAHYRLSEELKNKEMAERFVGCVVAADPGLADALILQWDSQCPCGMYGSYGCTCSDASLKVNVKRWPYAVRVDFSKIAPQ